MKRLLTIILLLSLPFVAKAQQPDATEQPQSESFISETRNPLKQSVAPRHTLSLAASVYSTVNSQSQSGFPIQLDFQNRINDWLYWGITGMYTSRKDAWVVSKKHYSDDNDQQMVMALGTINTRLQIINDLLYLQIGVGCGVGYHIMKYPEAYPNKAIFYLHLNHWWGFKLDEEWTLKITPTISSRTFTPYDAGAAYSHYPNVSGICSLGIEYKFNR